MESPAREDTPLWLVHLDEEVAYDKQRGETSTLTSIIRDLLVSYPQDADQAVAEAARLVDADYYNNYLPSDPLLKGRDDEGMEGFLNSLCDIIFSTVRRIPYDDSHQDAIVQLLAELAKLPPKTLRIWGVS